jgi:hypothetical protein
MALSCQFDEKFFIFLNMGFWGGERFKGAEMRASSLESQMHVGIKLARNSQEINWPDITGDK